MDRAIAASTQNQRLRRRWLLAAGAVALALGAVLAFRKVLKPSQRRADMLPPPWKPATWRPRSRRLAP